MKYISIIISITLSLFIVTSCNDMDTEPAGLVTSGDQKEDVYEKDPEKLQAEINALAANLIAWNTIGDEYHGDYGYPAVCMIWEGSGADVECFDHGYNKFSSPLTYRDRINTSWFSRFMWRLFYKQIRSANDIIATTEGSDDQTLKYFRGQALSARAFSYLSLVQTYQFTYKGNENKLGVPIVTEKTTDAEMTENPRATLKEVYTLIMSDLTEAIELLPGFARKGKDAINLSVAYGLRARTNLIMENWADAASDADKAMQGYTPYSITDVSKPAFNDATVNSWIWGNLLNETNDVVATGICNWSSMLCSLTGSGYAPQTGAFRSINSNLWKKIPVTDVRKGWWLDENLNSPLIDAEFTAAEKQKYFGAPYINMKFGPYKDEIFNPTNAQDWPTMRVEEMILIKAEALAMSGNLPLGKTTLEDFVKTYRDPSFTSSAATAKDLQDEVWFQRRVELWAEGFSFFDLKRLGKDVERYDLVTKESNYGATSKFNVSITDPIILWQIPNAEETTNSAIEQNPVGIPPNPIN